MILAYMPDLMMRSKLDNACRHYKISLTVTDSPVVFQNALATAKLVLVDLDASPELPLQLIRLAREHSSAKVTAFCSHVLADLIKEGQAAGAHRVYSNSTLTSALPGWLLIGLSNDELQITNYELGDRLMGFFDFLFGKKSSSESTSNKPVQENDSSTINPNLTPSSHATEEENWEDQGTPQEMQPAEVLAQIKSGNPPQLLDVREEHELRANGLIPGAVHIPLYDVAARAHELDKSRPVVVYCASGMRSFDAGFALIQAGFKDVSNLNGGIQAWPGEKAPYNP